MATILVEHLSNKSWDQVQMKSDDPHLVSWTGPEIVTRRCSFKNMLKDFFKIHTCTEIF